MQHQSSQIHIGNVNGFDGDIAEGFGAGQLESTHAGHDQRFQPAKVKGVALDRHPTGARHGSAGAIVARHNTVADQPQHIAIGIMLAAVEGDGDRSIRRGRAKVHEHQIIAAVAVQRDHLLRGYVIGNVEGVVARAAVDGDRFTVGAIAQLEDVLAAAERDRDVLNIPHIRADVHHARIWARHQTEHNGRIVRGTRDGFSFAEDAGEERRPLVCGSDEKFAESLADEGQGVRHQAGGVIEEDRVIPTLTVEHDEDVDQIERCAGADVDEVIARAAVEGEAGVEAAQRVTVIVRGLQVQHIAAAASVQDHRLKGLILDLAAARDRERGLIQIQLDHLSGVGRIFNAENKRIRVVADGVGAAAHVAAIQQIEFVFGEGQTAFDDQRAQDLVQFVGRVSDIDFVEAAVHLEAGFHASRCAAQIESVVLFSERDFKLLGGGKRNRAAHAHAESADRCAFEIASIGQAVARVVDDDIITAALAIDEQRAIDVIHTSQ